MAGDAVHVNADFHSAAMAAVDAAVGRLGGDDELDLAACVLGAVKVFVDDGLPAHAVAVLFLHGADDHDLVALGDEVQVLHDLRTVGSGSHAALLIGAAAAVDDLVGLIAGVGISSPVFAVADADGIDMGVDGDDLVASAHPADDVAELIELDLVIAQLFHLGSDALDDALFLAGLGRNCDHVAEELCHVGSVAFGSLFDSIIIHKRRVPPIYLLFFLICGACRADVFCYHHTT